MKLRNSAIANTKHEYTTNKVINLHQQLKLLIVWEKVELKRETECQHIYHALPLKLT